MIARPTAAVSVQQRSAVRLSTGVAVPVLRPRVACRFKEDDRLQDKVQDQAQRLKEGVKDTTNDLQNNLQNKLQQDGPSYDSSAVKVNPVIPAFTRRREVFSGRLAMLGFFAACFWEWFFPNHPNVLQQISGFSGGAISTSAALVGIVGLIAYNLISASAPGSPTFSPENQQDVNKRPRPATASDNDTQVGKVLGVDPKSQLGVTGFGFSKGNELFVGRIAMIGFTAAIIGQMMMGGLEGPGPLGQVAYYIGAPAEAFYKSVPAWFIPSALTVTVLAYLGGQPGPQAGEEDIY